MCLQTSVFSSSLVLYFARGEKGNDREREIDVGQRNSFKGRKESFSVKETDYYREVLNKNTDRRNLESCY